MITVLKDSIGCGIGYATVTGNRVQAALRREPLTRADWTTHDYNVHFCIGLDNAGDERSEIELSINGGEWNELPETQPLLYESGAITEPFRRSSISARTDLGTKYCMRFSMNAGDRIFIANTLVRSFKKLTQEFDKLSVAGDAERRVIGQTLEDRDVIAYLYGDPDANGTLLVTSGFHPPEPDTLATIAIMQFLATPEGKALLSKLAIAVVPVTNPDGYANGTQGSNAAGINFYWHFARELPDQCPEASVLWTFAESLKPRGYIDFHSYTFQLNKQPGPYHRPLFFHDAPAVRAACAALYQSLQQEAPGMPVTGFSTFAPHTLGAMLSERFDTVSLAKYHVHLAEGPECCGERGLRVFHAMADTLLEHGLAGPATPKNAGWRTPFRRARVCWAGLLRPTIGRIRRGQFAQVRFDRTGLLSAKGGIADDIA